MHPYLFCVLLNVSRCLCPPSNKPRLPTMQKQKLDRKPITAVSYTSLVKLAVDDSEDQKHKYSDDSDSYNPICSHPI